MSVRAALVGIALGVGLPLSLAGCPSGDGEPDAGSGPLVGIPPGDAGLFPPPRPDAGPDDDAGPGGPALCPPDDGFEDNDDRASAAPLVNGQEVEAIFCGGEDDWFALDVGAGCQLEARLRLDPRLGDLDLSLYAPDGTLVGASSTTGDRELVSVTTQQAGVYGARVRGGQGTKAQYRVRMTATCASELSCPADDFFEENDTQETARALSEGTPAVGIACPDDDDWFSFPTPPGCVAVAELDFVHSSEGDLDLRFVRPDGTNGAYSLTVTDDERAVESGTSEGPLAVRVYGVAGDTNTYRLVLDRVCETDLACPADDPFEPNDARADAARLHPPADVPATACGADEDWYRISVSAGCTLDVVATFSHDDGDLDLQLRNASDTILASSQSSDDDEELSYEATSATTTYLRVFVYQGNGTPRYRLAVTESCPDGEDP